MSGKTLESLESLERRLATVRANRDALAKAKRWGDPVIGVMPTQVAAAVTVRTARILADMDVSLLSIGADIAMHQALKRRIAN